MNLNFPGVACPSCGVGRGGGDGNQQGSAGGTDPPPLLGLRGAEALLGSGVMPGLGDVPSARAGAVPDARAGRRPKSSAGSRPQSPGACLGGDAQGSQWLVLPVLEHQPSGERVERSKTCFRVLRGPTVLTEGREMSAEGESLGSPSPGGTKAAGPWQGCDRGTHAAPAGAGAGHGAEAPRLRPHSSPGEEGGLARASPSPCPPLGTKPGHGPPSEPPPLAPLPPELCCRGTDPHKEQ